MSANAVITLYVELLGVIQCKGLGLRTIVFAMVTAMLMPWPLRASSQVHEVVQVARFASSDLPVTVSIHQIGDGQARATVIVELTSNGRKLASASVEVGGLLEGTGVYDVTGDGSPEIIVDGVVGAKTRLVTIYQFRDGALSVIFEWSGWEFEVEQSQGHPVLRLTPDQYGSIYDLFYWRDGAFRQCNACFPELYKPAIQEQQNTLTAIGMPAYVYANACKLGATALVYGKHYSDAIQLCDQALRVVDDPSRLINARIGGSQEELKQQQVEARSQILDVRGQIEKARKTGSTALQQRTVE